MKFWQKSLQSRLIIYFLICSLIPLLLMAVLAYLLGRASLQQTTLERLQTAAVIKEEQINAWVAEKVRLIEVLASSPVVIAGAEQMVAHEEGSRQFNESYQAISTYFNQVIAISPDLLELSILSKRGGKTLLSTNRRQEGQFHVSDTFFIRGVDSTFVQNVYFSSDVDKTTMTIATPLKSDQGVVIAVLMAHLDLNYLEKIILERTGLGQTGETYLVDNINDFISEARGGGERFPRGVHTFGIDKAIAGQNGSALYLNYEGAPVIGVYRWLNDRQMALMTEIHQEESLGLAKRLAKTILFSGLIAAAVIAFGVYLLSRQISKPIYNMAEVARKVAAGDLTQKAVITTEDEIGQLARSFNTMTEQLQQLYKSLEERAEAAEEANKAKSVFLTNTSHELRTPLNAIIGYSEMLQEEIEDSGQTDLLPDLLNIQNSGKHLLLLISNILDISRLESGKLDLYLEDFSLKALIEELIGAIRSLADDNNNKLAVQWINEIDLIKADMIKIRQTLFNILNNAVKFTQDGVVTLSIARKREPLTRGEEAKEQVKQTSLKEGQWLRFEIADTGVGIEAEDIKKIFEPFSQKDDSATRKFGGSGLGLTISQRLVEIMGGEITVESKMGLGSTFTIHIPVEFIEE